MITNKINQYMESVTSQNITFNRDIEMKDLEGNTKIVCKCYATIVAFKSISMYMDVIEDKIFNDYKADIQVEIDSYIADCRALAIQHNVPVLF